MRIILLGPPGAGKGTQAKVLAKRLNLLHISTGDLLRQNASFGSELGKHAKSYMEKGLLVPDDVVTRMLQQRIAEADAKGGFILDGYPRNINQARALDEMLKQKNINIDSVFYLDTSEPVIIQRLKQRLVCSACGANFHTNNMPPKKEGICDNCGGRLYQRTDDKEETVRKRLEVYRKEVSSLLEYYEQKKKLRRVIADEEAGIVLNKILGIVEAGDDSPEV